MKRKIEVTQDDINNGDRDDTQSCPIALALLKAGFTEPRVDGCDICYTEGDKVKSVMSPSVVRDFVKSFDRGLPVKPFSFELDLGKVFTYEDFS